MTEELWLSTTYPALMVTHVQDVMRAPRTKKGRRQLRLVGCGCCRLIWPHIRNTQAKTAVEVAERLADGDASATEVDSAKRALEPATRGGYLPSDPGAQSRTAALLALNALAAQSLIAAEGPLMLSMPLAGYQGAGVDAHAQIAHLFHDIFGNPFRPVAFDTAWRTDTAVSLARGMYESRDFGAMPILADALQDAGCEDEQVLNHCREPGPHVRGCWVCDLVLGKV
jgi:hypothetical protein